jgi:light-regulated signal transduction histidine kinase (bacteriophytochrome)
MVENVTERQLKQDQLERSVAELEAANQELQAFSDTVARSLRDPLLIVTNFSHHLPEALGEQGADDLERIRVAGRQMAHIVDDLRDLADVSRVEIAPSEVDLSSLAREIIDDLSMRAPDRNVRFEAEPGITALGDKKLLRLLLTNLLQNAWKYTGPIEDAWIELGIAENEGDVPTYHVRDNGIGFHSANRQIIFKAFERLHARTEFAGTGLGLTTVERIVRRHGGRVWAEGVPGGGAILRFTLVPPPIDGERLGT